jgi:uncharacterized coiled-coil protein SlyX
MVGKPSPQNPSISQLTLLPETITSCSRRISQAEFQPHSGRHQVVPRTSDLLLETTKGLEVTQQQAVDQLQVVQDQLVAQQTETKKLSEQIATLTEKLDALQQSVANIRAPSVAPAGAPPKALPSKR